MRNSDTELVRYLVLKDPDREQVLEQLENDEVCRHEYEKGLERAANVSEAELKI